MFYFDEEEFNEPAVVGGGATTATARKTAAPQLPLPLGKDHQPLSLKQRHQATTPSSKMASPPPPKPKATTPTFHDLYQLRNDDLGSGAYATVRTAVHRLTGREYAVKLVDKHEPGHTRSRIAREIEIFEMCKNHPNIVQLQEWFEDDHYCYMVFEKVYGGPLLKKIQQKTCFTEREASLVTRDIASALKFLHMKGIAHRDVKPENILCCIEGDGVSPVKLCDLDLASKPITPKKTKRGLHTVESVPNLASPVGSAEFMAPEVVDAFVGEAFKYDKRCDMWSLGVIIYIMLCGYPPFFGECQQEGNCGWDQGMACADCQENLFHRIQRGEFEFPQEEWANISNEAKELIAHLLVRDVRRRYTADDVLDHPWVKNGPPKPTPLLTPANLSRNDSTREIQQMNEHFNVVNRFTSTCCLKLGSEGSTDTSSSSGEGTPNRMDSLAGSPQSHLLEDVKTPMPGAGDGEVQQQEGTPSPPMYIERQFNYGGNPQQVVMGPDGMMPSSFYCAPPPLCSYPMGMMAPPPPAPNANMYMSSGGGAAPFGQQQQMTTNQGTQQDVFYPSPMAFCYYVLPPPPADMVNA